MQVTGLALVAADVVLLVLCLSAARFRLSRCSVVRRASAGIPATACCLMIK